MYLIIVGLVASSFMLMLVIDRIMKVFFEKRRTSLTVLRLSYLLFFALIIARAFLLGQQDIIIQLGSDLIINLAGYYIITLNYESSPWKRIIVVLLSYISLTALSSAFVMIIVSIFPNLDLFGDNLAIIASIVHLPPAYLIAVILQRFKSMRKNHEFDSSMLVIPVGLLLVFLFLGYFTVAYWYNTEVDDSLYAVAMGFAFIIFAFLAFYMYSKLSAMYENKLKLALQTQEREYYYTQNQLMQKSVEQMKSIRHDIKSHLATLRGYSAEIHANKITEYVDSLLGEIKAGEVYSDTGNIAFDSILNFKLQNAREDSIQLDLNLFIPESLNMDVADISTIMGNLLDNALTAVADVKDKRIKLDVEYSRGSLFIQVENTFDGVVIYNRKSGGKEKSITTKKNGGSHGYGLKNIKQVVEKYDGQLEVSYEENVFSAAILLYLDQSETPLAA